MPVYVMEYRLKGQKIWRPSDASYARTERALPQFRSMVECQQRQYPMHGYRIAKYERTMVLTSRKVRP